MTENQPQSSTTVPNVGVDLPTVAGAPKSEPAPATPKLPEPVGWLEFETARELREALFRLSDLSLSNIAVLTLRRVEMLHLIHAVVKRHGVEFSSHHLTEQDWTNAESIDDIRTLRSRMTVDQLGSLEACLGNEAETYLLHLDTKGRRNATRTLGRAAQHLIVSFEPDRHRIERLRSHRWLRIGIAVTCILALLGAGAAWHFSSHPRNNIALHRPVTTSSSSGIEYSNAGRLVDGAVDQLGFHTALGDPMPWAMIDLGAAKHFSSVVVYNRADCCKERAVPLVLEVSVDGVKFERLAERRENFDKWTVSNLEVTGRYVRLRLEESELFHLAEVAIYQ